MNTLEIFGWISVGIAIGILVKVAIDWATGRYDK